MNELVNLLSQETFVAVLFIARVVPLFFRFANRPWILLVAMNNVERKAEEQGVSAHTRVATSVDIFPGVRPRCTSFARK